jgi:hypothetical protein
VSIPGWWEFTLLGLAAFRTWRLVAEDDITETPRRWFLRLPRTWKEGQAVPKRYREKWALFLVCPWCAGFWISLAWWGVWQAWEHGTLVVATPFAISSVVGLVRGNLDPPE